MEDQGPPGWVWVPVGLVQQLEEPSSNVHRDSHDDALRHTWNLLQLRSERDSHTNKRRTTDPGLQTWDLRLSSTTHHLAELGSSFSFCSIKRVTQEHCLERTVLPLPRRSLEAVLLQPVLSYLSQRQAMDSEFEKIT